MGSKMCISARFSEFTNDVFPPLGWPGGRSLYLFPPLTHTDADCGPFSQQLHKLSEKEATHFVLCMGGKVLTSVTPHIPLLPFSPFQLSVDDQERLEKGCRVMILFFRRLMSSKTCREPLKELYKSSSIPMLMMFGRRGIPSILHEVRDEYERMVCAPLRRAGIASSAEGGSHMWRNMDVGVEGEGVGASFFLQGAKATENSNRLLAHFTFIFVGYGLCRNFAVLCASNS